jgi:hypothetical protein
MNVVYGIGLLRNRLPYCSLCLAQVTNAGPDDRIIMIACFLLGSVFAYNLLMGVYRLHIHPLSRFPGPRLAAVTRLYEMYFAAWEDGSFEHEIRRLHREYGMARLLFGSTYTKPSQDPWSASHQTRCTSKNCQ